MHQSTHPNALTLPQPFYIVELPNCTQRMAMIAKAVCRVISPRRLLMWKGLTFAVGGVAVVARRACY